MVALRYSNAELVSLNLVGRIVTEWACEFVYCVSCDDHAALGSPRVPLLNVLSEVDPFFAAGDISPRQMTPELSEALHAYASLACACLVHRAMRTPH